MFSTCITCHRGLGTNRAVSAMPVGRRIAFDLGRGRLWVICHRCGGWNLTPIEDRWEALEQCDRLFGAATVRASADTNGVAQAEDGTELVRIGPSATRGDIANWRYGQRLHRRRGRYIYAAAIGTGLGLALLTYLNASINNRLAAAWATAMIAVWVASLGRSVTRRFLARRLRSAVPGVVLRQRDLPYVRLRKIGKLGHLALLFPGLPKDHLVTGNDAADLLASALPQINWKGGTPDEIQAAIRLVDTAESGDDLQGQIGTAVWERLLRGTKRIRLLALPTARLLALEMAVTEDRELRALQGKAIHYLPAWEPAEGIAAIADDILVPAPVRTWLTRYKGTKVKPPASVV